MTTAKKPFKRIALSLSLIMMMLWVMLGTSTSVAWFSDTSPTLHNIFHVGEFKLEVSYKQPTGDYKLIEQNTKVLNDEDLYEPGFVKVQYLKAENKGTQDFNFKTAVQVTGYQEATNAYGETFKLQDYIRFGLVFADSEEELDNLVGLPDNRSVAVAEANDPLNDYSSDTMLLAAGKTKYVALILRMPEEVGNEANYRLDTVPEVTLGLVFTADQIHD